MGSLSPVHWVIVLVIVLLLFGPGVGLPAWARVSVKAFAPSKRA
ncbi:MAG: twin-arginine translocase TatA/TatE family subunit [Pseudomonadota bacterium]